ncbi:MAG: hypothetical protein PUC62_03335 [Oscillospiraceae bacterium]|nr:hypothetical protein [Oscillospiraceae bacterium]
MLPYPLKILVKTAFRRAGRTRNARLFYYRDYGTVRRKAQGSRSRFYGTAREKGAKRAKRRALCTARLYITISNISLMLNYFAFSALFFVQLCELTTRKNVRTIGAYDLTLYFANENQGKEPRHEPLFHSEQQQQDRVCILCRGFLCLRRNEQHDYGHRYGVHFPYSCSAGHYSSRSKTVDDERAGLTVWYSKAAPSDGGVAFLYNIR